MQPLEGDPRVAGYVFVLRGDLTRLACDAWLLPGDVKGPGTPIVRRDWLVADSDLDAQFDGGTLYDAEARRVSDRVWRVPLEGDNEPSVFLVRTGGHAELAVDWYLAGLDEFLVAVRAHRPGAVRTRRERPLVAVPLIGTGGGGQAWRRGPLIREILARLLAAAADEEFAADYALVTFRESDLAAAQAQRYRLGDSAWKAIADDARRDLASLLAAEAANGQLVLFLGSGVSAGAGLPLWDELLGDLAKRAGLGPRERDALLDNMPAPDAATIVSDALEQPVGQAVQELLAPFTRYSIAHGLLANLPVRETATTNYDRLFEAACERAGKPCAVLPYAPDRQRGRWLLKLHGSLEAPGDIVLTRDDYLAYPERRAALAGLVQGLLITKHMLFVGFSLADDNFRRIVHEVRKAITPAGSGSPREPFGTALMLDHDPVRERLWSKDLRLTSMIDRGAPTDPRAAARRLDVFLDRLLFETAASTTYLLDPAYSELLTSDDRALVEAFTRFHESASRSAAARSRAWPRVAQLASELGAGRSQGR